MAKKEKKDTKKNSRFFKDMKAELKKVVWPTPKQLVNSTVAVLTIVIVCALIVFVLDLGFEAINTHGISKMQSALKSKYNTTQTAEDNTTSEQQADEASSGNESTVETTTEDAQ